MQEIADAFETLGGLTSFDFDNVVDGTQHHPLHADFVALNTWSAKCPSLVTSRLRESTQSTPAPTVLTIIIPTNADCRNWSRFGGKWNLIEE